MFVAARQKTIAETIEPPEDALGIRGVVKFFSTVLCGCTIVSAWPSAIVSTIGSSEDALSMELSVASERGFVV
jgi:hypothetical protein